MEAVSLGTETHCFIICPADHNWGWDYTTDGNVTDAVYMFDVIVGSDSRDEIKQPNICLRVATNSFSRMMV